MVLALTPLFLVFVIEDFMYLLCGILKSYCCLPPWTCWSTPLFRFRCGELTLLVFELTGTVVTLYCEWIFYTDLLYSFYTASGCSEVDKVHGLWLPELLSSP